MARILVFDLENRVAGEVHAICKRGWAISGGVDVTFFLSDEEALHPWMQLGRMIYVDGGDKLPGWAGMIDTPWNAATPVQVTAYDIPYLLSRRMPYVPSVKTMDTRSMVLWLVNYANGLEDLYLREGEMQEGGVTAPVNVVNTTSCWDQLKKLADSAGMELQIRSEINQERRLIHYLDMQKALGETVQVVLQDGENGNMQVQSATVDGEFWNAVEGMNDASSETSKMYSSTVYDQDSVDLYRLRNKVVQFSTTSKSALQTSTDNYVLANGKPTINLTVAIQDRTGLFALLRLGNQVKIRATRLTLPGGQKGWSGNARITAMQFDESINQVTMSVAGEL